MLKSFIRFLIFLALLFGVGYMATPAILGRVSQTAMNYTVGRLQSPNLKLSNPSFKNVRISFSKTVTWDGFGLTATMVARDISKKQSRLLLSAETLTVEAKDLFKGIFVVSVKGLFVSEERPLKDAASEEEHLPEALQDGSAFVLLKLHAAGFSDIKMQIRKFAADMKTFSEEAITTVPIEFSAEEVIELGGDTYTVSLGVEKKGDLYCIVADRDDLKFISGNILPHNQTVTPADIEIIARNPLRAPQLLRIRSKAANTAANTCASDPKVPEDAYRHVLWSFLLARKYGADFATRITDAHEVILDPGEANNPRAMADHQQDYNNNEIGRKYAALGHLESDILPLVMTDPKVIRWIRN